MDAKEIGLIQLGVEPSREFADAFFREFKCQQCGQCCTQAKSPTDGILLEHNEDNELARLLGVSLKQFKREHTFTDRGNRVMKYPCAFHRDYGCSIYSDRPATCRFYPVNLVLIRAGKGQLTLNPNCPEGRRIYTEVWKRNQPKKSSS